MGLIPQQLLANENIRSHLNIALNMMPQAADGRTAGVESSQSRRNSSLQVADDEVTLKEIIHAYAQQNDLLFKAKPGRMHNGH
ncbi:hypothetical protein Ddye_025343 [Dipteronia dyeriana]|uniref:Uncharacterized protein n=1 Tax=Dipteronia dyeriana TaxID=168575 RepID=A0AAD9TWK4_9ROSI|nr:hypothetical protein Ddye_025343 [Dipteronia dyeriana]